MVLVAVFLMVGGGGFGGFFLPNLEFWVVDAGWWFVQLCLHLVGFEN